MSVSGDWLSYGSNEERFNYFFIEVEIEEKHGSSINFGGKSCFEATLVTDPP